MTGDTTPRDDSTERAKSPDSVQQRGWHRSRTYPLSRRCRCVLLAGVFIHQGHPFRHWGFYVLEDKVRAPCPVLGYFCPLRLG